MELLYVVGETPEQGIHVYEACEKACVHVKFTRTDSVDSYLSSVQVHDVPGELSYIALILSAVAEAVLWFYPRCTLGPRELLHQLSTMHKIHQAAFDPDGCLVRVQPVQPEDTVKQYRAPGMDPFPAESFGDAKKKLFGTFVDADKLDDPSVKVWLRNGCNVNQVIRVTQNVQVFSLDDWHIK